MIIKHLPPQEAQKIAAGEVVERPANIIKELIENALDAGATKITVMLHDGGKESLSITDNGNGMEPDDARICFLRHTTSKLTTFDDLPTLTTFGFRGEALASIAGVSHVTLTTRHKDSNHGIALAITEGKIVSETVIGCPIGTTITVKDLFYNVPARKKFLKTTATELNQITQLFKAVCLSNFMLHATLLHNGTTLYNCPPATSLQDRVAHLFESHLNTQLFEFSHTEKKITCTGILTGPHYSRYDRGGIFMFVNNRWIKNHGLSSAIIKGYMNVLPPGKYPLVVLSITIATEEVDINTHPKKEEVVFLHPRIVEMLVTQTIKETLEQHLSERLQRTVSFASTSSPYMSTQSNRPVLVTESDYQPSRSIFKDLPLFAPSHTQLQSFHTQAPVPESTQLRTTNFFPLDTQEAAPYEPIQEHTEELSSYALIGHYKLTYILLEHPEGLLLIDQHAAHERIIYERLATTFTQHETVSLLFPEPITCTETDLALLIDYLPLLADHGILLEQISPTSLVLQAKPVYAQSINISELLQHMLGWITESGKAHTQDIMRFLTEKLRAQIACKAAIKAGDSLTSEKMTALLKDLETTPNRFSCPHGRPTSWLIPHLNIEKKFKRKL